MVDYLVCGITLIILYYNNSFKLKKIIQRMAEKALERSGIGFMPDRDFSEELKEYEWNVYGDTLLDGWRDSRKGRELEPESVQNLKRLDSVLAEIEGYLPMGSKEYNNIFFDFMTAKEDRFFPSKNDIHTKYIDLMTYSWRETKRTEEENKDWDLQNKYAWNMLKDCRRVINGILKQEPLLLIPTQEKIFIDFAKSLSSPPCNYFSHL
jgi:hypothetical protein